MLAVVIEAMTVNSLREFDNINSSFESVSSKSKAYSEDVSLSEIIYGEKVTQGLEKLIVDDATSTFKNISNEEFVRNVYTYNNYTPFWFTNRGVKSIAVDDLFKTIKSDLTLDKRGNIFKRYKYLKDTLKSNSPRSIDQELKLDIQLTSLVKSYLDLHLYGSIQWWNFQNKLKRMRRSKLAANWVVYTPKYDLEYMFTHHSVSKIVDMTTPNSFGYRKMLRELRRLKNVKRQGGWKKIANSSQLRYGKSGKHVKQLIRRLKSSGDYTCSASGDSRYGPCLQKAVKRFQKRHGLYPSGKINRYTLSKLNLSVDWKIRKVLLNLDRIKRLSRQKENERYIMVNIPDFRLYYKERGREKLSMRVIVGDEKHHTPIFSNKVSFIVLNPYWIIPDSIVKKEIIPNLLKNPNYLVERDYEVRTSYNTNKPTIDATKVDWASVLRQNRTKKYKFMQPPGKRNALGKIKFKFPNQFAVYLHDTPNKKLFRKGRRAFSHGCIRVAEPNALLSTFAAHERSVSYNRSQRILRGKKKTQLNLSKQVPVHIVYLTAWINSDGLLHYRNDIYHYDKKQKRSIR